MSSINKKYSAAIFDLDGTLLNTLDDLTNAVNYAMLKKGYPERTAFEVRSFIGNGIAMLIKRSVPENTLQNDENEAYELFKEHYNKHMLDNTKPFNGITDLLKKLKNEGVKTAVVSNKNNSAAVNLVKEYFGALVDFTQGKTDALPAKPDPASLMNAINQLGIPKDEVIYIGDSDVDVLTAHNAGVECIGVTWGFRETDSLKNAGADYIADSTGEIFDIIYKF